MDPYEELGVPRDADAATVKKAYRKRVQKAHPDKGGSEEGFKRLQLSYDTLSDPAKRERYDRFGETGNGPDPHAQAIAEIAAMFLQILDNVDPDTTDLHGLVVQNIEQGIAQRRNAIAQHKERIKKRERAMKRIKRKGAGENMVLRMFEADVLAQKNAIARIEADMERANIMLKVLSDYSYSVDRVMQPTAFGHGTFVQFGFQR